jgi:hypothetical protein
VPLLVPWILGRLPGDPIVRWKAFAILSTAGAALALGWLCTVWGMTTRAAQFAVWLVALGFGPLLTLFNPYTADPLMYFLGPLMTADLFRGRRAMLAGTIGVLAKEVAAAPLWIFWLWATARRQWDLSRRAFAMAFGATLVWVWLQLFLLMVFNYSYAGSKSTDLLGGGDFGEWIREMGPRGAATAVFGAFGAVYLLLPIGFARAGRGTAFCRCHRLPRSCCVTCSSRSGRCGIFTTRSFQSPFWFFRLPDMVCWLFIASYGLANLRVGAQLTFLPSARTAGAVVDHCHCRDRRRPAACGSHVVMPRERLSDVMLSSRAVTRVVILEVLAPY